MSQGRSADPFKYGLTGFFRDTAILEEGSSPRTRSSWNDRLEHWEKAESSSETDRILRARNMVTTALAESSWIADSKCRLVEQGSFTNRTNTRGESDIDLRVQHPYIRIEFGSNVDEKSAYIAGGYFDTGETFNDVLFQLRKEVTRTIVNKFGAQSVDTTGSKAIRVKGLDGSRAEVDVVPAFTLDYILPFTVIHGVALYNPNTDKWTYNFPDQHIINGKTKRANTGHRFKRIVRCIKRMQSDMMQHDALSTRVPSFLIECLVYNARDEEFTNPFDDRYDRVKRVLTNINSQLNTPHADTTMMEINGVKRLFGAGQSWTINEARHFIRTALEHLGNL